MLTEFFESPLRIQELRDGPDGRLLEGFAQELRQAGYAEITARRHIRAAEHLIHWAGRRGKVIAALDEPMIEEFVQHLNRCRCPRYGRTHRRDLRKGARLFRHRVELLELWISADGADKNCVGAASSWCCEEVQQPNFRDYISVFEDEGSSDDSAHTMRNEGQFIIAEYAVRGQDEAHVVSDFIDREGPIKQW